MNEDSESGARRLCRRTCERCSLTAPVQASRTVSIFKYAPSKPGKMGMVFDTFLPLRVDRARKWLAWHHPPKLHKFCPPVLSLEDWKLMRGQPKVPLSQRKPGAFTLI